MTSSRFLPAILLFTCAFATAGDGEIKKVDPTVLERVTADVKYLASDELEGRGVETKGIELAADLILDEYKRLGLKPGMPDGTYRQKFSIQKSSADGIKVSDGTKVLLRTSDGTTSLKVGSDFQPLLRGGEGKADSTLVFVGYGISSSEDKYDDYADLDVEGKVVVMMRREPRQDQDGDAFNGKRTSNHSYIDTKVANAKKHKAAAILFVNDVYSVEDSGADEITPPDGFGGSAAGIPFFHVTQDAINAVLKSTPLEVKVDGESRKLDSLKAVSTHIDETLKPVSQLMEVEAEVEVGFNVDAIDAYNLIAVVEGSGPNADETIVVGGHYDHIGYGGIGSRARDRKGEIHNGADDNATGTAAVLEMARRIVAGPKPNRRIVIICFSGEERGLLGSKHYVREPVFPLDKTVAMLNFDMIGTLRKNKVDVYGVGTAVQFADIVADAETRSDLVTNIIPSPLAGSDHLPFFQTQIPCMFCFTGQTPRYHTPDDDFETLNMEGVVKVINFTEDLLKGIDGLEEPPEYQEVGNRRRRTRRPPVLGIVPSLGTDDEVAGVPIERVRPDSPAKKVGIQVGDVITSVNGKETDKFSDLVEVLQDKKAGDELTIVLKRGDEEKTVKPKLARQ